MCCVRRVSRNVNAVHQFYCLKVLVFWCLVCRKDVLRWRIYIFSIKFLPKSIKNMFNQPFYQFKPTTDKIFKMNLNVYNEF